METAGGSNAKEPVQDTPAKGPRKRWWMIAGGAVATAFLAAFGAWLFSLVSPVLNRPFEEQPLAVYVDDSETECDSYALPASLLEDVPVVAVDTGTTRQLAAFDGEWVVAHEGLPTVPRTTELTLHGSGDETVVIHDIDVVDFEPVVPDDEMVVIHECLPAGDMGGLMDVSPLAVNFAGQPPVLELTDPELRFPYEVAKDDPEVFAILIDNNGVGDGQACFCRWSIGVTWSAGEDQQQTVVEGESIGVATAIPLSAWQDYWFVDGEWSTDPSAN